MTSIFTAAVSHLRPKEKLAIVLAPAFARLFRDAIAPALDRWHGCAHGLMRVHRLRAMRSMQGFLVERHDHDGWFRDAAE